MQLLYIDACLRGRDVSRTAGLGAAFLDAFSQSHPQAEVVTRDLTAQAPFFLDADGLARREALIAAGDFDAPEFAKAREFDAADAVVIAAPFWDLSFPAVLKGYFEEISIAGIVFKYTEEGSVGCCGAGDLIYLTTRGGIFEGELDYLENGARYIEALAELYGIPRFSCVAAEGLDIEGMDVEARLSAARMKACALARSL
jgi:FMN-dependent NADH-azoreductase